MAQSGAALSSDCPPVLTAAANGTIGMKLPDALNLMRDSYEIARKRSTEISALSLGDCPVHLKSRLTLTSKLYLSLSTIFYSTLTLFQLSELHSFVVESALQLPSSLFDLKEWDASLLMASELRLREAQQVNSYVNM